MALQNRRPFKPNIWSTSPITEVCVDVKKIKRVGATVSGFNEDRCEEVESFSPFTAVTSGQRELFN